MGLVTTVGINYRDDPLVPASVGGVDKVGHRRWFSHTVAPHRAHGDASPAASRVNPAIPAVRNCSRAAGVDRCGNLGAERGESHRPATLGPNEQPAAEFALEPADRRHQRRCPHAQLPGSLAQRGVSTRVGEPLQIAESGHPLGDRAQDRRHACEHTRRNIGGVQNRGMAS